MSPAFVCGGHSFYVSCYENYLKSLYALVGQHLRKVTLKFILARDFTLIIITFRGFCALNLDRRDF